MVKNSRHLKYGLLFLFIIGLYRSSAPVHAFQDPSIEAQPIYHLCWNADGSRLVAGRTNLLSVYDSDKQLVYELSWEASYYIAWLSCHPTNAAILVVGIGGRGVQYPISLLHIDAFTGDTVSAINTGMFYIEAAIRPHSNEILVWGIAGEFTDTESRLAMWDISNGLQAYQKQAYISGAAWTSDGQTLLLLDSSINTLQFIQVSTNEIIHTLAMAESSSNIMLSPHNDRLVVTQTYRDEAENRLQTVIEIWDIASEQKLFENTQVLYLGYGNISWSSDQRYVGIANEDLFLMDIHTGEVYQYSLAGDYATPAAWNPITGIMAYGYYSINNHRGAGEIGFFDPSTSLNCTIIAHHASSLPNAITSNNGDPATICLTEE